MQAKSVPVRQESSRYATANGSPRPPAPGRAGRGKGDSTQGSNARDRERAYKETFSFTASAGSQLRWSWCAHDDGGHALSRVTTLGNRLNAHHGRHVGKHARKQFTCRTRRRSRLRKPVTKQPSIVPTPVAGQLSPRHAAVTSSEHRRSSLFPLRMGHHHHHYSRALLQCTIPP